MKKFLLLLVALITVGSAAFAFFMWQSLKGEAPNALEAEYLLATDRYVVADGARVRVRDEGPKGAPAILLVHGFTHSLETWDGWAERLKNNYRIIRYDLLGHGLTGPDPKERYSPTERAAFIGDLLDALNLDKVTIAGNSLGGLAAWRFTATNTERVHALILISPGAYSLNGVSDQPAPIPAIMKAYLLTASPTGVKASAQFIYADDAKITEQRLKTMRDMMRREGNGEAMIKSLEEFTLPDPTLELANITVPTLIQWGDEDIIIPVEQGERLVGAIPNARLISYAGVGHAAQEEAPTQTAGDAAAFLSGIASENTP